MRKRERERALVPIGLGDDRDDEVTFFQIVAATPSMLFRLAVIGSHRGSKVKSICMFLVSATQLSCRLVWTYEL